MKTKYYDIRKTLKTFYPYYVIIGKRSNGKTYSTLLYVLETFIREGKQAVYLRRWREDITGARGQKVFSDFYDSGFISKLSKGRYNGLHYWNRALYFCNYRDGKPVYNNDDLVCHFMCLSDVEHDKSTGGYGKVATVVFDEFIARQGYITDEFLNFTNVLSTIVRGKGNVRVIMLGNTISKFCPYFREMGLTHVTKMKQGTIDIYDYGDTGLKVLVEYTSGDTGTGGSDFYFAFDSPQLDMITKGAWELPVYPHCSVSFNKHDIKFRYYIFFENKLFECQVISKENNAFTFIFENKLKNIHELSGDVIYSLEDSENVRRFKYLTRGVNELTRKVSWFYNNGKVFYSDNEVGNYIQNYIKESVRK